MDTGSADVALAVRDADGVRRIAVTGDIDQVGARALRHLLEDAIAERVDLIEIDLAGATLFCCAAVAALQAARNLTRGRLVLVDASPVVLKVLTVLDMTAAFAPPGPVR